MKNQERVRKKRKSSTNEKMRKRNKIMDISIYSLIIIGMFLIGAFIGNKLFDVSAESYNVYAEGEKKNNVKIENKNLGTSSNVKVDKNNSVKDTEKKQEVIDKSDKNEDKNLKKSKNKKEDLRGKKICYLTFDDGPTKNITPQVLEILKEHDIKSTFFVLGQMAEINPDLIHKEKEEGHLIANHGHSHDYNLIYRNPESLIKDFKKCEKVVESILKEKPCNIVRFPGGSFNKTIFQKKVNEVGYHFVDWNCLNGDAEGLNVPEEKLFNNVKKTIGGQEHIVVLMHDAATKQTTVRSLSRIIDYIKKQGYTFKTLDEALD